MQCFTGTLHFSSSAVKNENQIYSDYEAKLQKGLSITFKVVMPINELFTKKMLVPNIGFHLMNTKTCDVTRKIDVSLAKRFSHKYS